MSTQVTQIDGVSGNPIGGVSATYNTSNSGYGVGSSNMVGSSAIGSSGLVGAGQSSSYGYQTTTQYVQPATTTTYSTYQQPAVSTSYSTYQQPVVGTSYSTYQQPVVGASYTTGSTYGATTYGATGYNATTVETHAPHVVNTVVNTGKEVIKGESRIEYVPFEKKIVEYREEARVERVPRTRKITQYRE